MLAVVLVSGGYLADNSRVRDPPKTASPDPFQYRASPLTPPRAGAKWNLSTDVAAWRKGVSNSTMSSTCANLSMSQNLQNINAHVHDPVSPIHTDGVGNQIANSAALFGRLDCYSWYLRRLGLKQGSVEANTALSILISHSIAVGGPFVRFNIDQSQAATRVHSAWFAQS